MRFGKIAVPRSYDPKGPAPREELAYLNEGEQALLLQLIGRDKPARHAGLPSFVPPGPGGGGFAGGYYSGGSPVGPAPAGPTATGGPPRSSSPAQPAGMRDFTFGGWLGRSGDPGRRQLGIPSGGTTGASNQIGSVVNSTAMGGLTRRP